MSSFLILLENNKFTRIDNAKVITADNMKFEMDIEGSMKNESPDDFHIISKI